MNIVSRLVVTTTILAASALAQCPATAAVNMDAYNCRVWKDYDCVLEISITNVGTKEIWAASLDAYPVDTANEPIGPPFVLSFVHSIKPGKTSREKQGWTEEMLKRTQGAFGIRAHIRSVQFKDGKSWTNDGTCKLSPPPAQTQ